MRLESISGEEDDSSKSGVGDKFLIISISLTIFLNGSVAVWFLIYVQKHGIEKFIWLNNFWNSWLDVFQLQLLILDWFSLFLNYLNNGLINKSKEKIYFEI